MWNLNNGQRFETYALRLADGSQEIVVNGAATRHFERGDPVIIAAFAVTDEPVAPCIISVDEENRFLDVLEGAPALTSGRSAP